MNDNIQSNSAGWLFFVKTSFGISLAAMSCGVFFIEIDLIMKAYFALCALFLVSSTITLSKTMRDQHESDRLINKLSEAKAQQLMKEYTE
jgi:hypothetical protein